LNPQDRAQAGERPHPVQEAPGGDMAWIEGGSFVLFQRMSALSGL